MATIQGFLDWDVALLDEFGGQAVERAAVLTCATTSLSGVSRGDTITVGSTNYLLRDHHPIDDGALSRALVVPA